MSKSLKKNWYSVFIIVAFETKKYCVIKNKISYRGRKTRFKTQDSVCKLWDLEQVTSYHRHLFFFLFEKLECYYLPHKAAVEMESNIL